MKLAFVTSFPRDPSSPRGGVEAVSVVLAPALAALGDIDVHVVTADAACSHPESGTLGRLTIHRLPRRGGSTLGNALRFGRKIVQDFLRDLRPDVIHAHDTYGLMVQGLPVPRVFTVHGFIHADTRLSGQKFAYLRSLLWRWHETRGWADQPHIISISPYVREALGGIARGVIHDIDNPIDTSFFDIVADGPRKPVIFSAGAICRRKNPLRLVESLAHVIERVPEASLRLAGHVQEEEYAQQLRRRIGELGLEQRVQLLGSLDQRGVRAELAAAGVFALVSLEEGAPMGIEEAMAAGVPVVASNRCGMPYMIRDGESGYLVDPTDARDVGERLAATLEQPQLAETMGQCGRRIAQERFHPQVVARRTREVYRRAVRTK